MIAPKTRRPNFVSLTKRAIADAPKGERRTKKEIDQGRRKIWMRPRIKKILTAEIQDRAFAKTKLNLPLLKKLGKIGDVNRLIQTFAKARKIRDLDAAGVTLITELRAVRANCNKMIDFLTKLEKKKSLITEADEITADAVGHIAVPMLARSKMILMKFGY